jgi:hypothetical protein
MWTSIRQLPVMPATLPKECSGALQCHKRRRKQKGGESPLTSPNPSSLKYSVAGKHRSNPCAAWYTSLTIILGLLHDCRHTLLRLKAGAHSCLFLQCHKVNLDRFLPVPLLPAASELAVPALRAKDLFMSHGAAA